MDKFYGKIVFETAVPVENPDNLILFLNSIEFQKPELLRLDFATIRTSVSKNSDGTCILTANCYDFDYDTYKADYEKLGLEQDGFTYDYFKSISNDSLKLTEILVECEDKAKPHKRLPLRLKSVRLYFEHHSGDEYLNFEEYATKVCRVSLLGNLPLDSNCRPLADEFIKTSAEQQCRISALQPLKKYKVYVQFEGCIAYGVLAGDEEEAKEKALSLYEDEEPEYLIDKLMHKVCDCESCGFGFGSQCTVPIKTKFNRKLSDDEFNGLNKIASSAKIDCWFYIMEEAGRDIIWDVENNKILSIEDGVSQLMKEMGEPITAYGVTEDEIKAVEELFKQIKDTEEE